MSFLRRTIFGPEARNADSLAELLALMRGSPTFSGTSVTPDTAMRHAAVFACVDLIAELMCTLPIDAYRRDGQGVKREISPTPSILTNPSPTMALEGWLRQDLVAKLIRGNSFGMVQGLTGAGYPSQIEWLEPGRVRLTQKGKSGPVRVRVDGGQPLDRYPLGPIVHSTAYELPGLPVGLSVVQYAQQSIGLGLSAEEFAARWFGDGAHPSAVLETDQAVTEVDAKIIKERVIKAIRGRREPAVLGKGLKWNQIQVSPEESQFLDTINANRAVIASFFRLSPEAIGAAMHGSSVTYANREQRALDLLVYALQPWIVRTERMLTSLLPRPQFVKFNLDGLLRVDAATRWRIHDTAIRVGVHSRDDVRHLEDEPPLPEGQKGGEYLWPPYAVKLESTADAVSGVVH